MLGKHYGNIVVGILGVLDESSHCRGTSLIETRGNALSGDGFMLELDY